MTSDGKIPADSAGIPWAGREMKSNPFAGDDGSADQALASALTEYAASPGVPALERVVAALASARVLVPILAELDVSGTNESGQLVDKEASAGVVALEAPDGRRALPVFSSVSAVTTWRADARPVPVESSRAALSAVAEDWALLVVDPGGPITALIPRPAVWAIAQGQQWLPAVSDGIVAPAIVDEITTAVGAVPQVRSVRPVAGSKAEVAVVMGLAPGLDRDGLDGVLAAVNSALAGSALIGERVDSLELQVGSA